LFTVRPVTITFQCVRSSSRPEKASRKIVFAGAAGRIGMSNAASRTVARRALNPGTVPF
jgi:hypothetical protein